MKEATNIQLAFGTLWTLAVLSMGGVAAAHAQAALPSAADKVRPLMVGTRMPAAQLQTATGETLDLGAAMAQKPAVLVFYRGGW